MSLAPFGTLEDSRKGKYGSLHREIRQSDETVGPTLHQMLAVVCQWTETAVSHVQWLRWSLFRPLDSLAKTTRYIRVGARGSSDAYKRKNRGKEKKLVLWKGLVSSHLSVFALSSSLVASCRCVLWSVEPWQEPAPQSCISTSNTEANDPLQHGRGGTRDYMHASTHTLTPSHTDAVRARTLAHRDIYEFLGCLNFSFGSAWDVISSSSC